MGWGIIKEPSGRLAIWSSNVDDFIARDCSPEEAQAIYRWNAVDKSQRDVREQIANAEQGIKIGLGPHDFDECMEIIKARHGKAKAAAAKSFVPQDDPPPATPVEALALALFAGGEKQERMSAPILEGLRRLGYDLVPTAVPTGAPDLKGAAQTTSISDAGPVRIAVVSVNHEAGEPTDAALNEVLRQHHNEGYRLHTLSHEVTKWEEFTSSDDPSLYRSAIETTYTFVLHRIQN